MPGYQQYSDMIMNVSDQDKQVRDQKFKENNITKEDFDWNEVGCQGAATVYLKDGEPFHVDIYIWSMDPDQPDKKLCARYGSDIILVNWRGGNGHESAEIQRVK